MFHCCLCPSTASTGGGVATVHALVEDVATEPAAPEAPRLDPCGGGPAAAAAPGLGAGGGSPDRDATLHEPRLAVDEPGPAPGSPATHEGPGRPRDIEEEPTGTAGAAPGPEPDGPEAAARGAAKLADRPNFSGVWVLAALDGDFESWLSDMRQPQYLRVAARLLNYGLGKVRVRCEQSGDSFFFAKTLTDPRRFRDATARFKVGDTAIAFLDDIGPVTAQSARWDHSVLVFDAVAVDTKLPLQLRMYFDELGNFVEEMVSCTGRSIKYTFSMRR